MKQIVNYIVRSQKLAGFLMMKGFKLHSIQPSNENNNRNVFIFTNSSMLQEAINNYKTNKF